MRSPWTSPPSPRGTSSNTNAVGASALVASLPAGDELEVKRLLDHEVIPGWCRQAGQPLKGYSVELIARGPDTLTLENGQTLGTGHNEVVAKVLLKTDDASEAKFLLAIFKQEIPGAPLQYASHLLYNRNTPPGIIPVVRLAESKS